MTLCNLRRNIVIFGISKYAETAFIQFNRQNLYYSILYFSTLKGESVPAFDNCFQRTWCHSTLFNQWLSYFIDVIFFLFLCAVFQNIFPFLLHLIFVHCETIQNNQHKSFIESTLFNWPYTVRYQVKTIWKQHFHNLFDE